MRDVYVISSCRTAVGTFGGSLRDVPAADLGATVIAEALKRGNVKGEWLDEVMFGNVLSAAQGQNVARQCMVKAGVPLKVPAYTVSMVWRLRPEVRHRGCPRHPVQATPTW